MAGIKTVLLDVATRIGILRLALAAKHSPPVILMYHGVSRDPRPSGLCNFEGKHLAMDVFARHLRILRRSRNVIQLSELVDGMYAGRDMRNTVAITFDDGYENNVLVAAPMLADFRMPASFFLSTGFIGTDRLVWTDHLEVALDRTSHAEVRLPTGTGEMSIRSLQEKKDALRKIKGMLKGLSHASLDATVENIARQLDVPDARATGDYRFMNWGQVRGLVRNGFEVGAHTISHPILTRIPYEDAVSEILGSRDMILRETGQCCPVFCFPNGKASDFSEPLLALCREHFRAALATTRGAAMIEDIYQLRRLSPSGLGGGENMDWLLLSCE